MAADGCCEITVPDEVVGVKSSCVVVVIALLILIAPEDFSDGVGGLMMTE